MRLLPTPGTSPFFGGLMGRELVFVVRDRDGLRVGAHLNGGAARREARAIGGMVVLEWREVGVPADGDRQDV